RDHGYEHYEIANWALPGRQSRHNRIYWLNGQWLGLGPGAHSQWKGVRFANVRLPEEYARRVAAGERPVVSSERVDAATAREDTVILGLRLREGVDADRFARRFGVAMTDVFGREIRRVVESGLAQWDGSRLRLTEQGLYLSNQVFQEFIRVKAQPRRLRADVRVRSHRGLDARLSVSRELVVPAVRQ